MRRWVSGSLGRRISWALVCAMMLPLFVLAMPPKQARAQLTRLHPMAVLDFGVMPNTRTSAILSRNATDAVVVELARTGRYDLTPRTQLNQTLSDLSLALPLNNNGIQKLGQALGVDYVASGDVTNISFRDNPRRAVVTLSVRITDVVSGELANGAIATGFSAPTPAGLAPDDDTLINQAISDAAFNAVKTINNYTLPEATVLTTAGTDQVTLNRGGRDGITSGTEMIVIRGHEQVGRIRVTLVSANDSTATIIDSGKGIRPEDRARTVFRVPGYDVTPNGDIRSTAPDTTTYSSRQPNRARPILTTIFGIAAAILLASLIFSSKSNNAGNGVSSVTAQAYAEGSILLSTPDTSAPRVRVTWRPASDVPFNNIYEYNIYRDGNIIGSITNPAQTQFIDSTALANVPFQYYVLSATGIASSAGGSTSGQNGTGTTTTTTNGTGTTTSTGTNSGFGTNTTSTGNSSGGTNTTSGPPSQVYLSPVTVQVTSPTPMTVGVPHRYSVSVIYMAVQTPQVTNSSSATSGTTTGTGSIGNTGSSTNQSTIVYRESNLNAQSGVATPLARPAVQTAPVFAAGSSSVLSGVRIQFTPTLGANSYIVEFADNPNFTNKVVEPAFYASSVSTNLMTSPTPGYDLTSKFTKDATGTPIYYRVGARNSADSPGPSGEGTPNAGNYIYSANEAYFAKPATPPNPPT